MLAVQVVLARRWIQAVRTVLTESAAAPVRCAAFLALAAGLACSCGQPDASELRVRGARSIRAQLRDSSGRLLPATPIQLLLDRRAGQSAKEAQRAILRGRTDGSGHFRFGYHTDRTRSCSLWADVGDGWRLVEVLSDHAWADLQRDEPAPSSFEVRDRDREFRLHVSDQADRPIAGAAVRLVAGEEAAPVGHLMARSTDANGALRWRALTHGKWWVDVSSPGYAPVRTRPYPFLASDPSGAYYEVRLLGGREVTIEILDENGRPEANAEVEYAYANSKLPTVSRWAASTSAAGTISITLPRGVETLIEAASQGRTAEAITAGDRGHVRLQLGTPSEDER